MRFGLDLLARLARFGKRSRAHGEPRVIFYSQVLFVFECVPELDTVDTESGGFANQKNVDYAVVS